MASNMLILVEATPMNPLQLIQRLNPIRRNGCHFAARMVLAVHFVGGLALPIPSSLPLSMGEPSTAKEEFPCQSSLCGCKTARQCWTYCCCTTRAQRIEWARRHNVPLPPYLEAVDYVAPAENKKACCSNSNEDGKRQSTPARKTRFAQLKWVSVVQAQKCQGQNLGSPTGLLLFPPPLRVGAAPDMTVSRCCLTPILRPATFKSRPPTPPPRLAA